MGSVHSSLWGIVMCCGLSHSEVAMAEVESAVLAIDHAHPPSLLAELLTGVFPDPETPLPLSQVTTHLTATGLTRHSLPPSA